MIFPNAQQLNIRQREEIPIRRPQAINTGRGIDPRQSTNPSSSSTTTTTRRQPSGNRGNLGVHPTQGGFTTAVLIVFALGGFLFVCGLFMLFGGLGDHSQPLVGLGVGSVVGGVLLSAMGWTLCLKMKRKRHHYQEGCVCYRTTGLPGQQVHIVGPPPAYSPLPIPFGFAASEPSPPCQGASCSSSSPAQVHSPLLSAGSHREDTMFPFPPPSYDEAIRND